MEENENFYHTPIMFEECISALNVEKDKLYFDGTLGGGGHSEGILSKGGRLIASDKDDDAINFAANRFKQNKEFEGRYTLVKSDFKNILKVLKDNSINALDGAILDLGISSHHIDDASRGFSYMRDGSLDMRMDKTQGLSAMTIVNEYEESEIADILYLFGEEPFSRKIAAKIIEARKEKPITTTLELSRLISSAVRFSPKGGHPAKKTFQALRIAVNSELDGLKEVITDIAGVLNKGARLLIITFHSLEDRIVKQTFKELSTDCICDKSFPVCVCNHKAQARLVTSKGIRPGDDEQKQNSRSKSASLRIIEKL